MKNLIILFVCLFALFSCNKSNTPPTTPPATDSLLQSLTVYEPLIHVKQVYEFGYDQHKLLASFSFHSYDSSGSNVQIDSTLGSFTMTDSTTPPDSYDLVVYHAGTAMSEHHLLTYTNQNWLQRDSASTSQSNNYTTKHFTFDGLGNTTIEAYSFDPQTQGSLAYQQVDTMNLQGNDQVYDIAYTSPGSSLIHVISRSFSTDLNPTYNAHFTNNLAILFSYNSLVDFRSVNLPSQATYQDANFNVVSLNFIWTKDAAGRVIQGIGSDPNSGATGQIYTYSY